jgi:hypothetical protein
VHRVQQMGGMSYIREPQIPPSPTGPVTLGPPAANWASRHLRVVVDGEDGGFAHVPSFRATSLAAGQSWTIPWVFPSGSLNQATRSSPNSAIPFSFVLSRSLS